MVRSVAAILHSWYQLVLVRVTVAVAKHHEQNMEEKGFSSNSA
jgi:hypothetical protein